MSNSNYDIHCHFFNGSYAFRELVEISWRTLRNSYPYKTAELPEPFVLEKPAISLDLQKLIDYVAGFFAAFVRSPLENYEHEQESCFNSRWGSPRPLITAPLMMDIYFLFDDGTHTPESLISSGPQPESIAPLDLSPLTLTGNTRDDFIRQAEELKKMVLESWHRSGTDSMLESIDGGLYESAIEKELDAAIEEFVMPGEEESFAGDLLQSTGVQVTRGFRTHLQELIDLQQRYPDTVKPFLAVDPRRIGIVNLVRKLVVEERIFKGIKLYPPLGYLPTHPALYPVYELCIEHDIPITVHTSPGGFPTLCKTLRTWSQSSDGTIQEVMAEFNDQTTPSDFFANPANWSDMLNSDKYRNLRLNFAHFGGQEAIIRYAQTPGDDTNWTRRIITFMQECPNVYADLSYCPDETLCETIATIIRNHDLVGSKLMFGTDFVMIMMNADLGGLGNYFNRYAAIDQRLRIANPMAFLAEQP
jgi:predicted TIM-barrel fold metal-dependent hydrolase